MFCPKCRAQNDDQAGFCSNCGAQLHAVTTMNATQEAKVAPHNEPAAPQVSMPTSIASNNAGTSTAPMTNITNKINSSGLPNVLLVVRSMIMKPITAVKEELPKIETLKDAAIIGVLCTLIATSFSALTTILNAVWTEAYDSTSRGSKMVFEWSNLEHIDLLEVVGKRFLINLIVIFVTGGVLVGLASIFKGAKANYARMLAIYAVSIVPAAICAFAASIISRMDSRVAEIVGDAGVLYGTLMLYEGAILEAKIKDDKKVYYIVAVVAIAAGISYITMRILYGS